MTMWWEASRLSSLKYPLQAPRQSSMDELTIPTQASMVISMVIRTNRTARGLRSHLQPVDTSTEIQPLVRATQWMPFSSWMGDREGKLQGTPEEPAKGTPAANAAKPTPRPPT